MEATVNVSEQNQLQKVIGITFRPGDPKATVILDRGNGEMTSKPTDFSALVSGATATQKATIRTFMKRVAALALKVDETEVDGDLF